MLPRAVRAARGQPAQAAGARAMTVVPRCPHASRLAATQCLSLGWQHVKRAWSAAAAMAAYACSPLYEESIRFLTSIAFTGAALYQTAAI